MMAWDLHDFQGDGGRYGGGGRADLLALAAMVIRGYQVMLAITVTASGWRNGITDIVNVGSSELRQFLRLQKINLSK